jgi:hypothetical protein
VKERSDEEQELLWRAEQLQNASADIDEPLRRHIEKSRCVTKNHAAWLVTGDEDRGDALRRFDELMNFLLQPPDDLTPEELEFRNEELMTEYRLPSLLRIYKPGVWYEQFCAYLKEFVWPKWVSSSVPKSRAAKKSSKKRLEPTLSDHGKKTPDHRNRERDLKGRFTGMGRKVPTSGRFGA